MDLGKHLRGLADAAWDRGNRDLAADLHNAARRAEAEMREDGESTSAMESGHKPPSDSLAVLPDLAGAA